MIINPVYMPYERYAPAVTMELNRLGFNVPAAPGSEENWREWAGSVAAIPAMSRYAVPSPAGYTGWRDWALAFSRSFTAT